jgi:hypothetical protein
LLSSDMAPPPNPHLYPFPSALKGKRQVTLREERLREKITHTANEGPIYKCLVTIYVFPEMKLLGCSISKTEL